jgi:hypothetical protein
MKILMALMIFTSSLSVYAAQNAAKDMNCCQTCKTSEAVACRGSFGQKRPQKIEKPSGIISKVKNKFKGKAAKGNDG